MKRGDVWQPRPGKGMPWYAWRRDPRGGGGWRKRSTGKREQRAALQVAARWIEEAERGRIRGGSVVAAIEEYVEAMRLSPGVTSERHVAETRSLLVRLCAAGGFATLEDVTAERVFGAIEKMSRAWPGGWSHATRNGARAAIKALTRWAWLDGRLERDPLARTKRWPMEGFERRRRRALKPAELERLLERCAGNGTIAGLAGYQRSLLYLLAVATGLRLGELGVLTVRSFDFSVDPPEVRVPGSATKNGREAVQAILPVVEHSDEWVRRGLGICRQGTGRAMWELPRRAAEMLREDLRAAGIPFVDEDGRRLDFHALRGTLGTWLALGGATQQVAQKLLRHAKPETTARHYTHLERGDLTRAGAAAVCSLRGKDSAMSSGSIGANRGSSKEADRRSDAMAGVGATDSPSGAEASARQGEGGP